MSTTQQSEGVAVLGVGMHPWGKWGRPFTEYGVHAARAALTDAGVAWPDVDLVVGGETVRNGYGGYVAGATFAQALGWNGARVATSYAACATGAQALDTARARILAGLSEVALVVGAAVLAAWRAPTTPAGATAAMAVTVFTAFAFGKKAFCNYYVLVIAVLAMATAARRNGDDPRPAASG